MANNKYSLGIDIGGTNTVFGLVDKKGNVIKKDSILTMPKNHPKLLLESIFNFISSHFCKIFIIRSIIRNFWCFWF